MTVLELQSTLDFYIHYPLDKKYTIVAETVSFDVVSHLFISDMNFFIAVDL